MPRYIDAEKLAEHKFSSVTYDRYVSDGRRKSDEEIYAYKVGYNEAIASIEQFAPTVDAVQVIRCRNCLHGKSLGDVGTWCDRHEDLWPNAGYCSKAERRPNG